MTLSHAGSAIDVHIRDPVTNGNASMRTHLPKLFYYILYCEGPWAPQVGAPSTLLSFCSSSADSC